MSWDDVEPVDLIGLEVGYRLIPLVDRAQGGELMGRIKGVRKKLSEELGFLVQAVHIRDNLELGPNSYRITILGAPVGESEVFPDRELAINPGQVSERCRVPRPRIRPSAWMRCGLRSRGTIRLRRRASPWWTRKRHRNPPEPPAAIPRARTPRPRGSAATAQPPRQECAELIEDLVPKMLPMSVVVKVLQYLLLERVPIRNLRTICETLAELAPENQDPVSLVAAVRVALGRSIVQNIGGLRQELPVITLDPALEQVLQDSMAGGGDASPGFEPGLADRIQTGARGQHAASGSGRRTRRTVGGAENSALDLRA